MLKDIITSEITVESGSALCGDVFVAVIVAEDVAYVVAYVVAVVVA